MVTTNLGGFLLPSPYLAVVGGVVASGGASLGTAGAADGAVGLDVLVPRAGSFQAHRSAGEVAVGFDCAAAPFADEPLIQRISAVPCENSGVLSATAVSAALTTSKMGKKMQREEHS